MKKMLFFTKSEKIGIFVLLILMVASFVVNTNIQKMYSITIDEESFSNDIQKFKCKLMEDSSLYNKNKKNLSLSKGNKSEKRNLLSSKENEKNKKFIIEINSTDTLELKKLRGIGSVYARRIIKYRNYLGGYYSKSQLKEVYGITPELYSSIEKYISLDKSKIKKFSINADSFSSHFRHPYLEKKFVYKIVNEKKCNCNLTNDDLKTLLSLPEKEWDKLSHYLE